MCAPPCIYMDMGRPKNGTHHGSKNDMIVTITLESCEHLDFSICTQHKHSRKLTTKNIQHDRPTHGDLANKRYALFYSSVKITRAAFERREREALRYLHVQRYIFSSALHFMTTERLHKARYKRTDANVLVLRLHRRKKALLLFVWGYFDHFHRSRSCRLEKWRQ